MHGHLSRLEEKGYIRRDPTKPRAIEILGSDRIETDTQSVVHVPIVGKVTAGSPITAVESVEEHFPLPANLVSGSDKVFMLRISGNSMIEAGIFDEDLVVVRQQQSAYNGEIVVALTEENEATVKRFYKEKDHFRLQPENSSLEPILLDKVSIIGKVIGVYRHLH